MLYYQSQILDKCAFSTLIPCLADVVYSLLQHWDLTGQSNLKEEYHLFFFFFF